jgi:nucleoside-diphosphate-sugar epimerase
MRVVVVGASGNVGTAVLRRLTRQERVDEVTGVARRIPDRSAGPPYSDVSWYSIDVGAPEAVAELTDCFAGAAAVIHLAWQIQPSHDRAALRRTNIQGSAHVAQAAVRASVPTLVVASSIGAYAPGPKDERVDEDWPHTGVFGSTYSQHKAAVERLLDTVEAEHPQLRVVRLRPGLVFQESAGSEIARYFVGPLAPLGLLRLRWLPLIPGGTRLRLQAEHASDVAEAYVRATLADVRGAFNIAAEPVLDAPTVAARYAGRTVPVPPAALRLAASLSWHARLQPTEPGWVRLAAAAPLMSVRRAERELGWRARIDALTAFDELLRGMARGTGTAAPPLRQRPGLLGRLGDLMRGRLPGHGDPYSLGG